MNETVIIVLFVVGVILAFPLAIALVIPFGWLISLIRHTCPNCNQKKLKQVNFVKRNPPPAFGCYLCEGCGSKYVMYSNEREFRSQADVGVSLELFKITTNEQA